MTFQPYPTGSGSNDVAGPALRPPQPPALRNAVRLMLVGAGLALIGVIISLAFSSKIKSTITTAAIKANADPAEPGQVAPDGLPDPLAGQHHPRLPDRGRDHRRAVVAMDGLGQ